MAQAKTNCDSITKREKIRTIHDGKTKKQNNLSKMGENDGTYAG